jgi:succinate-semialdehyde dehydrogenase/glutarate-semialdehyde dehydrogenase
MCVELMHKAGIPPGVIQTVTGRGSTVGNWLSRHPGVDKITLTGSTEVGIETYKNAASHLAHVSLELGGNDSFIVWQDADLDLATTAAVRGRTLHAGQVCCASKRFLIHNSLKDEFAKKLAELYKKLKVGDPLDESTQVGCLISEEAAIKVEQQVQHTVSQGGKIILGGKRNGAFFEPTIIVNVPKTADVMKDMEIFGPIVPITGFDTLEEAIEIANGSRYGLNSCIFTRDIKAAWKVANELECGGVIINGESLFRSVEMPFGGHKYTGIGTEGALYTFNQVTLNKSIVLKNII